MSSVVEAPREMMESLASLHFPPKTDRLLQDLMDRNTNGLLTAEEREELAALAELSETLSLVRADAISVLGRNPE